MKNKLSIHGAVQKVLIENKSIMTLHDIYKEIVNGELCTFNVSENNQLNIVRTAIKKRSINSNHNHKVKHEIFYQHDDIYFGLKEWISKEKQSEFNQSHSYENKIEDYVEYIPDADLLDPGLFLEKEWHEWLFKHIKVNGLKAFGFGELRLYDEAKQSNFIGKYNTRDIGEMDLLLRNDTEIIVIELKRKGIDETVGQICRYIGWVEEHLKKDNEKVYGIIVAQEINKKLKYAIKPIKDHIFYQQLTMTIDFGINSRKKEVK